MKASDYLRRGIDWSCRVSGAACLLTLPEVSAAARAALLETIERGPENYNTGDGILGIRGEAAMVYARLEKAAAIPLLEKLVERYREDPLYSNGYLFKRALEIAQGKFDELNEPPPSR